MVRGIGQAEKILGLCYSCSYASCVSRIFSRYFIFGTQVAEIRDFDGVHALVCWI